MENKNEKPFVRPENLLKSIGIDHEPLTEDERAMQRLLLEEYKKSGLVLINEIRKYREANPKASLGDAVKFLFGNLETT